MKAKDFVEMVNARSQASFDSEKRVKSYAEFLSDFFANPYPFLRNAAQYAVDMMEHYGTKEVPNILGRIRRFNLYDAPFDPSSQKMCGQEVVQNQVYNLIKQFAQKGPVNKLVMLHGPNGSSKSTMIDLIMRGLEHYSRTDEGVLYTINWIFTENPQKTEVGFSSENELEKLDTFAYLEARNISSKVPCELKCNPLHMIPKQFRQEVLKEALAPFMQGGDNREIDLGLILHGELCQKCRTIGRALYNDYKGDWQKVLRHVQVERIHISKRFRVGAVTIEPQQSVDAFSQQITGEWNTGLPPSIQNLTMHRPMGDLVDANVGVVEYSDFFKRPIEMNKYLLSTCERGTINLPNVTAYLNMVLLGTSNEKHLSAFKRHPDYTSFKGRMELVRSPYILRYTVESQIYREHLNHLEGIKHVAPHVTEMTALWAVLTRLKRPNRKNYTGAMQDWVGKLTPMEKAMLYDNGTLPDWLVGDDRKVFTTQLSTMVSEYHSAVEEFESLVDASYEGRRGASPREMKILLSEAALDEEFPTLTPMAVIKALKNLANQTTVYDFLRIKPNHHYHNPVAFIEQIRAFYIDRVKVEIHNSFGLIEETEFLRKLEEYIEHVKCFVTKSSYKDPKTGNLLPPNETIMQSFEKKLKIKEEAAVYRNNLINRIAAWKLDHPDEDLDYTKLFSEMLQTLHDDYFEKKTIDFESMAKDFLTLDEEGKTTLPTDRAEPVLDALNNLCTRYGHDIYSAKEAVSLVLQEELKEQKAAAPKTEKPKDKKEDKEKEDGKDKKEDKDKKSKP